MKGSASTPSSATMNGTRCAIRREMKATSRERRSSLATYGALGGSRSSKGCGELRPAVQSVRALTALDLYELLKEGNAFRFGEAGSSRSLSFASDAWFGYRDWRRRLGMRRRQGSGPIPFGLARDLAVIWSQTHRGQGAG